MITPTSSFCAPFVANCVNGLNCAMTEARSTVNELTFTFGTVFEPELPPDDDAGVDELPQAATKSPTLHASDTAPPFRWRTIIPDPRIAASLSFVCADRDSYRWLWTL